MGDKYGISNVDRFQFKPLEVVPLSVSKHTKTFAALGYVGQR